MTIAQRIELRRLGYTKEEVNALAEAEKQPEPAQVPQPDPEPAPAPQPEPEPAPAPQPNPERDPILEAINNLTLAIQASNIKSKEQPQPTPDTAADVFNSLLN